MTKQAESQLVELLKLADSEAVAFWYKKYRSPLLSFFKQRVENTQDAEELAHATFLNCLKNLPLFLGTSSLWTWMQSIAQHEVADFYRKKYAKRAIKTLPLSELLLDQRIENTAEISQRVTAVLQKMTAHSRELLLKKYVDSQKVAEIALELGKTIKSVESELFRARKEFKSLYIQE
ncbi:RNA polymerase sigma factor [Candidatus Woesebacteria bacterium]|nr:RNA polymerase sigma factor [Candidatus Woesebacteria bacterium]